MVFKSGHGDTAKGRQVREGGRIVSRAAIIAVAVNDDGKREVLGVATGPSEAETFWTDFLRSLADRGLRGVKLVIADDHKGLRAATRRVFNATHQRCRIHWMRNALARAPTKQRAAVAAMLKTVFAQETKVDAEAKWEVVADALREKQPRLHCHARSCCMCRGWTRGRAPVRSFSDGTAARYQEVATKGLRGLREDRRGRRLAAIREKVKLLSGCDGLLVETGSPTANPCSPGSNLLVLNCSQEVEALQRHPDKAVRSFDENRHLTPGSGNGFGQKGVDRSDDQFGVERVRGRP